MMASIFALPIDEYDDYEDCGNVGGICRDNYQCIPGEYPNLEYYYCPDYGYCCSPLIP